MAFSKDEIRKNLPKKRGFHGQIGGVISSPALKLLGPKLTLASKHTSTGHKKR
jgi:hypothetical protein